MKKSVYKEVYTNELNHGWYVATRKLMISSLKNNIKKNAKILDAGCGTGGTIKYLANAGFKNVQGIDNSPEALKFCRKRRLQNVQLGSVNNLPFKDQSFDAVICLDVLYHKEVIPTKALAEFKRVLKSGSILYLQEPAYNWLKSSHDVAIEAERRFTRKEVKELITSADFKIIKCSYFNSILLIPIILKRLYGKLFKDYHLSSDVKPLPQIFNKFFLAILTTEKKVIDSFDFPFGLSIICLSKK